MNKIFNLILDQFDQKLVYIIKFGHSINIQNNIRKDTIKSRMNQLMFWHSQFERHVRFAWPVLFYIDMFPYVLRHRFT